MKTIELYRFVEKGTLPPFSTPQNLCFILDKSGSMDQLTYNGQTRFSVVREQLNRALDQVNELRLLRGVPVHINIIAFSGTSVQTMQRLNVTTEGIDELKAFVNGLTTGGGTPYDQPLITARSYFLSTKDEAFTRNLYFITDGEPDPLSTFDNALNTCADLINRTGQFSVANGNDVNIYGIGVDINVWQYLGQIDNTASDGLATISTGNANELYNAIINSTLRDAAVYTYTSGDADQTFDGALYKSITIGRTEPEVKGELARANLDITTDLDNQMARRWLGTSLENTVVLTLYQRRDDESTPKVAWKGRLISVKPSTSEVKLTFESIFTSMRRTGNRAKYQKTCRHLLYGRGCGVAKEDYAVTSTVSNVADQVVTCDQASGYPDGYFAGGILQGADGASRFILRHVGTQITLLRPLDSLTQMFQNRGYGQGYGLVWGGVSVTLYPGCDRSRETCNGRFNNLNNYGGFPFIPTRNPFDGSSIV